MSELSQSLQVDVFAYDYSGYGYSKTKDDKQIEPSEQLCYQDIEAVYTHMINVENKEPKNIVLMGRSLGTGPSCELASKNKVGGVILQSPLLSAVRVAVKTPLTLPIDIFANQDKIRKIKAPIFIVHGELDQVIDISHGKELYRLIQNSPYAANPWWIPNAGHNDIEHNCYDKYMKKLEKFLVSLDNFKPVQKEEKRKLG